MLSRHSSERRPAHLRRILAAVAAALCLWLLAQTTAAAAEGEIECRVLHETLDGFYVDRGTQAGLAAGSRGRLLRRGQDLGIVEVIEAAPSTARARILGPVAGLAARPQTGDVVVFQATSDNAAPQAPASPSRPPPGSQEPFVPLLQPFPERDAGFRDSRNITHGRLRLYELYQIDQLGSLNGSMTRLYTDGSVDRIQGTPWALEWTGDVSLRAGDAFEGTEHFEEPRAVLNRLALYRKFDDGSFVRAGRFLPYQLPSIGYVDGAQGEKTLGEHFRAGTVAGLKPERIDLEASADEPFAVLYGTAELGTRGKLYYSGTAGVLASLFEGEADRIAVILDQTMDLSPKLTWRTSGEVDLNDSAAETHDGPRLTRLNTYLLYRLVSFLSLRAGVDHDERPDTRAERAMLPNPDVLYFDRGYWRYWAGGTIYLPSRFQLDDEVAYYDAPDIDFTPHWRVTLSRSDTILAHDYLAVSVYNIDGLESEGYGARVWGVFPFLDDRLTIRPAAGIRMITTDTTERDFAVSDLSLFADWFLSRRWSAFAGATEYLGDSVRTLILEVGIDFRW